MLLKATRKEKKQKEPEQRELPVNRQRFVPLTNILLHKLVDMSPCTYWKNKQNKQNKQKKTPLHWVISVIHKYLDIKLLPSPAKAANYTQKKNVQVKMQQMFQNKIIIIMMIKKERKKVTGYLCDFILRIHLATCHLCGRTSSQGDRRSFREKQFLS